MGNDGYSIMEHTHADSLLDSLFQTGYQYSYQYRGYDSNYHGREGVLITIFPGNIFRNLPGSYLISSDDENYIIEMNYEDLGDKIEKYYIDKSTYLLKSIYYESSYGDAQKWDIAYIDKGITVPKITKSKISSMIISY